MKAPKKYEIITKPTTEAFCQGAHTERKVITAEWLDVAIRAVERDPKVERYYVNEIKKADARPAKN